jgi:hypothetical protein
MEGTVIAACENLISIFRDMEWELIIQSHLIVEFRNFVDKRWVDIVPSDTFSWLTDVPDLSKEVVSSDHMIIVIEKDEI